VATRPARTVVRTVTAPPVSDQPLALSLAQRQILYRTVVQREFYPAPIPPRPPVAVRTDLYAAPTVTGYPPRTIYPADDDLYRNAGDQDYARDYVYDNRSYDPYTGGYRVDPYRDRDYRDPYHTAYRWDGVPLVVGARIPQSVPLVAVPEPVAASIPATRPYSYAVLDNRVYLVDPETGVIVAEIAR
jgi:Protein of unknown function (DUF1236)